jgi:transcriptional regulator with XRE-family HTH domain
MTKRAAINEALRLLRIYCRFSQTEMADKLDVAQSMISDIESGRKTVSMDVLERYSQALNIKMSRLLFFAEHIEGQPPVRRGQLIVAERVLKLLEKLRPPEHAG